MLEINFLIPESLNYSLDYLHHEGRSDIVNHLREDSQ